MNHNEKLVLRDNTAQPTQELLEKVLGNSYLAYEEFQDTLADLEIEQQWQWYAPYKAWFARGQYYWSTPRGTEKEKTLYWLYVFDSFFIISVWFKEKNRQELLNANVSDATKELIKTTSTMGKLPTFPVEFNITNPNQLTDIYTLIKYKKKLEL